MGTREIKIFALLFIFEWHPNYFKFRKMCDIPYQMKHQVAS
jgi:hypothetical protein